MDYGITDTGFIVKPVQEILRDIETGLVTEFGSQFIQTAESPMGQINGVMASEIAQVWELGEDIYSSLDPDQAEGVSLDNAASFRSIRRNGLSDTDLRALISNDGESRIDILDLSSEIASIDGVIYSRVFINSNGELTADGVLPGQLAVAVLGGSDEDIAQVLRTHIAAGVDTFGNASVSSVIDGFCRSSFIVRPNIIEPTLNIQVRRFSGADNCPPPALSEIKAFLIDQWNQLTFNGQDVSSFTLRVIIERQFPNVELISFNGSRDGIAQQDNTPVDIAFIEISQLTDANVTVS